MADQDKIDTITRIRRKTATSPVVIQNPNGLPPAIDGVNFSAMPEATLAQRNASVLERDRERGVTISTAPVDPIQEKREKLKNIPLIGEILGGQKDFAPLYAEGTMGNIFVDGIRRDGIVGFITEGFRKKMNPTQAELGERFYTRYDALIDEGVDPDRAKDVAMTDLIQQTNGQAENIQDLYNPEAELTDEERGVLRFNNVLEDVFAVLDAPIFVGSTKIVKAPIVATIKNADKADDVSKVLKGLEISDDVAEEFAPQLAKATNELEISRLLDDAVSKNEALTRSKIQSINESIEARRAVETVDETAPFVPESRVSEVDEALPSPTAKTAQNNAIQVDEIATSGKGSVDDFGAKIVTRSADESVALATDDVGEQVAELADDIDEIIESARGADFDTFTKTNQAGGFSLEQVEVAFRSLPEGTSFNRGGVTLSKQGDQIVASGDGAGEVLQKSGIDLDQDNAIIQSDFGYNYRNFLNDTETNISDQLEAVWRTANETPDVARTGDEVVARSQGEEVVDQTTEATANETLAEATIASTQEAPTKSSPLLVKSQDDPLVEAGRVTSDSVEASSLQSHNITTIYDDKGEAFEQFTLFDIEEGIDFTVTDNKKLLSTLREQVPDPTAYKDISGFKGQARDIWRNTERVFGQDYDVVKREILDPFDDAKGALVDNRKQILDEFEEVIVKGYGIKKRSKESRAVMDYGEKLIGKDELVKEFGQKRADEIVEASKWFRQRYDEMLDEVNAIRKVIYPRSPEKQIPRRQDYFRHFKDLSNGWSGLANIFETSAGIDPRLSGISAFTKPKSKFLSFAQRRIGNKTERDAVGGFLDYVEPFVYAKHVDPHINDFRILAKSLADRTAETKNINNYIEMLHDYANDLSGKTNPADRYVQKVIPYGRKTFRAMDWANSRVKANTIVGNVSSTIAQIFNVPQGIGSAKHHSVNGAIRTMSDIWNEGKAIKQSTFIKERYGRSIYDKFNVGMLDNLKSFASWMTGVLDEVGTKFIWNAHYEKAIREGIEEPIRYADDVTRKMVAGRGIGEVPLLQKSRLFQVAAPFQLEVTNLWWVMGDFIRKDKNGRRNLSAIATTFVAMYIMNDIAERLRGNDVGFDPINAIYEGYKIAQTEEEVDDKLIKFGGRVTGEVFSNVPLGQTIASAYPEYGTNIGGYELPTRSDLFGQGDPTRFGSGLLVVKGLQDPFFKLVPSYGGSQIKKTIQGAQSLMSEDVTDKSGKIMYSVERDIPTAMRVLLFGKYSTPEAREFFAQPELKQQAEAEMRTLYRINQDLIASDQTSLAQSNVDELSDEAYDMYKKVKREEEKKDEEKDVEAMMSTVRQTRAMLENGRESEAQAVVDAMSDEEYEIYEKAKKKLTEGTKIEQSEKDIIGTVFTYAQAIGVDPVTAFDHIFSGEKIRRVDNWTIIVERLPLSESAKIKEERGSTGNMRLDHTMPLQLGGSNSPDNLKLVEFDVWESYTPVENHLGKLLRDDKIEKREAQDLIIKFKNGEISADEILNLK